MNDYAGTGAHLTDAELLAWTSLLDSVRIVDRELEVELNNNSEMTHREYEVLVRLDGHGGRIRMSLLARQIEVSAALVSQTINRLEDRGWVRRESSSSDRRGVHAALTTDGRSALAAAAGSHAATVKRLLLDPMGTDLETVGRAMSAVADHLRLHRSAGACGDTACTLPSD